MKNTASKNQNTGLRIQNADLCAAWQYWYMRLQTVTIYFIRIIFPFKRLPEIFNE